MEEESQNSDKQIISATASKIIKISNEFPSINPDRIEFKGRLTINIAIIGKKKMRKKCFN